MNDYLMSGQTEELVSNKEIVDKYLNNGLLRRCLDYQFGRLSKTDPWKMQFKEDMWQDLIVFLYTYDPEKLNDAERNNHINALTTRILQNNIYSSHSSFYHKYLRFRMQSDEIKEFDLDDDDYEE